ncbi:Structural maintenance of chromosomes protein 4 [Asimina triloba]
MKQKIKKLEEKLEKDSLKIDETVKANEESTSLIPKLEEEIPKLQQLLLDEEKILEDIKEQSKAETEKYRSALAVVRAELEPWEKQLIEHKGKLDVACTERKLLKEKHDSARMAFEDAQRQMDDIVNKLKSKGESVKKLQGYIEEQKNEALEARKDEQECINKQDTLIPLEQAARQKVTELLSVLEMEKSQGSVIKAILQAKESKQIEGIYGRLGDLGAIDAKYDVAISTACSGLDFIVVETTVAAQACVELLRKKNLGVATFMILEEQIPRNLHRLREKINPPEGVPRLFDLVNVADERMKVAFFAVLGNTVVAKDLDQIVASRIAYGRNNEFRRVVTLDGALFDKAGTMTGGGSKPRGGKMGTSIRASVSGEAVENAEKELGELVNEINRLRQSIRDAVWRYQASEKSSAHSKMELAKCQKEIDSLTAQHDYIEKQLDSLKAASQPRREELDRLEELDKIISLEEKELERLAEGSKKLKEKASELQNEIENAGGEKLKNQKLKVEKKQSDIDKRSTEINRHKVQIVTGQKTIKKLTKGIEESKKDKERFVGEKEKMVAAFKEIEQKAFVVQENYKKTQELIEKHRDVLDKAKDEYNKLKKTMDESRTAEVDAEYKLQDSKKLLKEWEIKGKGFKKRLEDLKVDVMKQLGQIQKDGLEPEKLQATLNIEALSEPCDLKRALEMVALLEAQIKDMNPNLDSIAEYQRKASSYNQRVEELNAVTQERDELKRQYDELRKKRLDEFMAGFNTISLKLKEMYQNH